MTSLPFMPNNNKCCPTNLIKHALFMICTVVLTACSTLPVIEDQISPIPAVTSERAALLDTRFAELLQKHGVITAGIGIIKNGELVWTGYYGEQRPGLPASENTQFDIASITKTVTAETILRLAGKTMIDLDEPMANYWLDGDIAQDPFAKKITPRMALSHSTGFPNWRFIDQETGRGFNPNLPLRFLFEPGTSYGYSGEGLEYVAKFAEKKLDTDFESLVIREIYEPTSMTGVSFSRREANFPNIVHAIDARGTFNGHYCRPGGGLCRAEGEWSAADDMRVTVRDHAKFLISVMNAEGYSASLARERNRVQIDQKNEQPSSWVLCDKLAEDQCPQQQGYGLGWRVADYGDHQIVGHGGSDFSEVAFTYFYTDSKDGILIFLNAPNKRATAMMPEAIKLLHPTSPFVPHYEMRAARSRN